MDWIQQARAPIALYYDCDSSLAPLILGLDWTDDEQTAQPGATGGSGSYLLPPSAVPQNRICTSDSSTGAASSPLSFEKQYIYRALEIQEAIRNRQVLKLNDKLTASY